jgi:hypothetical protein
MQGWEIYRSRNGRASWRLIALRSGIPIRRSPSQRSGAIVATRNVEGAIAAFHQGGFQRPLDFYALKQIAASIIFI